MCNALCPYSTRSDAEPGRHRRYRDLATAAQTVGIPLLDHIIIQATVSFRSRNVISSRLPVDATACRGNHELQPRPWADICPITCRADRRHNRRLVRDHDLKNANPSRTLLPPGDPIKNASVGLLCNTHGNDINVTIVILHAILHQ